jgi:hypothetical protein
LFTSFSRSAGLPSFFGRWWNCPSILATFDHEGFMTMILSEDWAEFLMPPSAEQQITLRLRGFQALEILEKAAEFLWKWRCDTRRMLCIRLRELHGIGMKKYTLRPLTDLVISAIAGVANEGMPNFSHVETDLMTSACDDLHSHKCVLPMVVLIPCQGLIVRDCSLYTTTP